ncbi:unnamed protein product [Phaedon cochleariae]|uniref:Pseudouridine synthase RsuA/RluA-like domain-containing protein n=1 Tax=Phaedon cochleariae TaxID=80249 RepID=A0A9P0DKZ1_PHACE|nr:unnamed protein product [Phaedon cochleariae]
MKTFFCSLFECVCRNILSYFLKKKIKILHQSNNFLLISKDYDMKINSDNPNEFTVQTQLRKQYPLLANDSLFHEFYFPHRLDFATSGVMCIPIHKKACQMASEAFSGKQAKKYYIGLARGLFSNELIDLDIPIGEDSRYKNIHKMCTYQSEFCTKSRNARTIFLVLEEGLYDCYPATKILIRPVTGRRHQIRVHCSYLGHTIIGDYTYSNRKDVSPFRMYLHAFRLVLPLSLEHIDVQSCDPFLTDDKWHSFTLFNEINEQAFKKLEICVKQE